MKVVKLSFRNTQLNDIMTVGDVQQVRDQLYKTSTFKTVELYYSSCELVKWSWWWFWVFDQNSLNINFFFLWLWENWDVVNPLNQHVTQFYHAILPSMPKTERPQRDKNNIHLLVIIYNKLYKFLRCRCFQIRVNCFGMKMLVLDSFKFIHEFDEMFKYSNIST